MEYTTKTMLPPEVNKFSISESSFRRILEENLGGEIESIDVDGDEVDIKISGSFLKKILGERYEKKIGGVEVDGGEVDIRLQKPREELEDEDEEETEEKTEDENGEEEKSKNKRSIFSI